MRVALFVRGHGLQLGSESLGTVEVRFSAREAREYRSHMASVYVCLYIPVLFVVHHGLQSKFSSVAGHVRTLAQILIALQQHCLVRQFSDIKFIACKSLALHSRLQVIAVNVPNTRYESTTGSRVVTSPCPFSVTV
jgi:hypothetical protein